LGQLWLFWLAPMLGAVIAGLSYKLFSEEGRLSGEQKRAA